MSTAEKIKMQALLDAEKLTREFPMMTVSDTTFDQPEIEDLSKSTLSFKQGAILRLAVPMKQNAMWSSITLATIAAQFLLVKVRRQRLRAVLQAKLLPLLLHRRMKHALSTVAPTTEASSCFLPENEQPTGAYLRDCCPWLAQLNDVRFLDMVARSMQKLGRAIGETVVTAGESSQRVLYIATSGKFEWVDAAAAAAAAGTSADPTPNNNSNNSSRLLAPFSVGDVFGGQTVFARSLIARTRAVVWYISLAAFQSLLVNASLSVRDHYQQCVLDELQVSIPRNFPLTASRLPYIRHMAAGILDSYLASFEPVLLTSGKVLAEEGGPMSTVYLIAEGNILRKTKGSRSEPSVEQYLSIKLTRESEKRYMMLCEEPCILPERHRCTVSVVSDYALGYALPAAVFTSLLLDDPKLLLKLREDLLQARAKSLSIDSEALRNIPLFKEFPSGRIQTLSNSLTPVVFQRSQPICQSQQSMREIFLVVRGEVRDPRNSSKAPPTLASSPRSPGAGPPTAEKLDRSQSVFKMASMASFRAGGGLARIGTALRSDFSRTFSSTQEAAATATTLSGIPVDAKVVVPVEEVDANPTLPSHPVRTLLHVLGGSYEGLLLDKWPQSWEATSVTEVFTLPTALIREEYNALARHVQTSILHQLRLAQKADLGLDVIPNTKLPPMSLYKANAPGRTSSIVSSSDSPRVSNSARGRRVGPNSGASLGATLTLDNTKRGSFSVEEGGGDEASTAPSSPVHVPQPPRKKSVKSVKSAKSTQIKAAGSPQQPKLDNSLVPAEIDGLSSSLYRETMEMRNAAQRRNERQQRARNLPIEESIRRRMKVLNHESCLPLNARLEAAREMGYMCEEDVLYFHLDSDEERDKSPVSARHPNRVRSVPEVPLEPLRTLPNPNDRFPASSASFTQAPPLTDRPMMKTVPAAAATSAPSAAAQSPARKRGAPPPLFPPIAPASERRPVVRPNGGIGAASSDRRWFHEVPAAAPLPGYPHSAKAPSSEPFDVLLRKTLQHAH